MFVSIGTYPEGSTWARNPIPRVNDDNKGLSHPEMCPGPSGTSGEGKGGASGLYNGCLQFEPPCPQDNHREAWSTDGSGQGACSGDWTAGVISDHVIIPQDITPGAYVLGWYVSHLVFRHRHSLVVGDGIAKRQLRFGPTVLTFKSSLK